MPPLVLRVAFVAGDAISFGVVIPLNASPAVVANYVKETAFVIT